MTMLDSKITLKVNSKWWKNIRRVALSKGISASELIRKAVDERYFKLKESV